MSHHHQCSRTTGVKRAKTYPSTHRAQKEVEHGHVPQSPHQASTKESKGTEASARPTSSGIWSQRARLSLVYWSKCGNQPIMPSLFIVFVIASPVHSQRLSATTRVSIVATPVCVSLVRTDHLPHVTSMLVLTHLTCMLLITASRLPPS